MQGSGEVSCSKDLVAIRAPSVTVYLPQSLRRRIQNEPNSFLLYGWTYAVSPAKDKIVIVVAGNTSLNQARLHSLRVTSSDADGGLSLVGVCVRTKDVDPHTSDALYKIKRQSSTWLETCLLESASSHWRDSQPTIKEIRVPSARGECHACAINVISYTIPRAQRMKYYNLERIVLPSASSAGILDRQSFLEDKAQTRDASERQRRLRTLIDLDPLRSWELQHSFGPGISPGEGLRMAIGLMNQCSYINDTISRPVKAASNGHRLNDGKIAYEQGAISKLMRLVKICCHFARIPLCTSIRSSALIDISATALQLDLRLGQLMVWPRLAYLLRNQRRKDQEPISNLAPRYIALYNGIWLVMNDLILGQAVGISICDNSPMIAGMISRWTSLFLLDGLVAILDWLDNWPAGVKLNLQLSQFFRDLYTNLTHLWRGSILSILVNEDSQLLCRLVYMAGIATRILGLTMMISITIDLIGLLSLHCTVFYRIQQTAFRFFCTTILSLFQLFRGKKRNPLRGNRVDQATYDLDQLLLGTIFFTLLVFLWLTVAIYYLYFGLLRLGIIVSISLLQTALAFLNHLPLFALMLRIKEPDRLPAGVHLHHRQIPQALNPLGCYYYEISSVPLDVPGIFRGYHNHLEALQRMPSILWSPLAGRRI